MASSEESTWQPIKRLRAHEQVLAQVEEHILRGRLRSGDRLPGERALAELLGVSRPSVREALRVLEFMGIVTIGWGSGSDAGAVLSNGSSEALSNILRLHLALANYELEDVVEARTLIERAAARAAAQRATGTDLAELRQRLALMENPDLEVQQFNRLDTEFHVRICQASGNALLGELMQALRDAVEREMVAAFEGLPDWRHVAAHLREEHMTILDAIEGGDPAAAAAAVERHIASFYHSELSDGSDSVLIAGEAALPGGGVSNGRTTSREKKHDR
jgi:DNA-binding FadR family transcriptional regulator